jgi:hypothetical protein
MTGNMRCQLVARAHEAKIGRRVGHIRFVLRLTSAISNSRAWLRWSSLFAPPARQQADRPAIC